MLPSSGASGIRLLQAKLSSRTAFVFIGLRQEAGIHLDPGLLPIVENPSPTQALFLSVGSGATTLFPSADYWHHEVIPIGARSGPRNCSHRRSITNKNTPIRPLWWGCPSFPVLRQVEESLGPWQLEVPQPCMSCRSPVCRAVALFVVAQPNLSSPPPSPRIPLRSPWAHPCSFRLHPRSPRVHPGSSWIHHALLDSVALTSVPSRLSRKGVSEPAVRLVAPAEILLTPRGPFMPLRVCHRPEGLSLPSQRLSLFVSLILGSGFRLNAGCIF